MKTPLAPTGAASLFILDDEGVFFVGPRQELYVLNTAATFLWCCVEEGLSVDETIETYGAQFGVSLPQAWEQVADLLNGWWSLGYIEHPGIRAATDISLSTALGRLLCSPSLRARFAHSPAETASVLRVRGADVDTFMALDPVELQAQARRTGPRRNAEDASSPGTQTLFCDTAGDREPLSHYAARCRVGGVSGPRFECHYGLLGTNFAVRFASRAQLESVHPALAHMAIARPPDTHVQLDVVEGEHGHVIVDGAIPVEFARELAELAPRVKNLLRQLALGRETFFLELHAGVVSDGTHCVLLPAAPGSGKTTLTAGLVCSGFDYFSDEVALLDEETLRLRPVPLGLGIKPGSVEVLARLFPAVRQLDVHSREDGRHVRYLTLSADRIAPRNARRDARWLVFPRFVRDTETRLRPISRPDALRRLMHECMVLPKLLDDVRIEKLVGWMRRLDCYDLTMGSLQQAVELVRGICGSAAKAG